MISDMTVGNPGKILFKFSFLIAAGNILQQLYNLADMYIVGRYAGVNSMAAVGSATNAIIIFINIAVGLNMGTNVVLARLFGAKDYLKIKNGIKTAILMALALGIAFSIIGTVATNFLLSYTNTPKELFGLAADYLKIYFLGQLFLFLFNIIVAIMQALGDSRTTFISLITSSIINIFLDIVFIKWFSMGVKGAALATVISEFICFCWSFFVLRKALRKIDFAGKASYDIEQQKLIVSESIPAIMQRSVIAIGVTMMQALINQYGVSVMAGYAAASKVVGLVCMPVMDVGNAVATFTAQNFGARKTKRVSEGIKAAIFLDIGCSAFIIFLAYVMGRQIMSLFLENGNNIEAMNFALTYMRILCIFQIIQGVLQVYNGAIRGAGDMTGFTVSFLLNLTARVATGYGLAFAFGEYFLPFAWPIGWFVGLVIGYVRYCIIFKNVKRSKYYELTSIS